jgi:hypothetical protein
MPKRQRPKFNKNLWFHQKLPTLKDYFYWKVNIGMDTYYEVASNYKGTLLQIMAEELSLGADVKRCFFCNKRPVVFEIFEKLETWHVIMPSKDMVCPECLDDLKLLNWID